MSATKLYAAGYTDLVRVTRGDKRPTMFGWQDLEVTPAMAAEWDAAGSNIGLRGDRFPGIDIDLGENARVAEEIVQIAGRMLGGAPKRYSPKAGSRLLVYALEGEPFLKMRLTLPDGEGAVEILPAGRQYLIKGIHPRGGPYTWKKVDGLWQIPAARLTRISKAQALEFLEHLQQEYGGRINVSREAAEFSLDSDALRAPSPEAVAELLATLPNTDAFLAAAFPDAGDPRDTWVAMGHAVKGAAGDAGLDAFVEWTMRWEDGPADPALAAEAYRGFRPERYGWPTLQRIYRTQMQPADDVFGDDALDEEEPPRPATPDAVHLTDEQIVDRLLPALKKRIAFTAGAWRLWNGAKWEEDGNDGLGAESIIRRLLRPIALELQAIGDGCATKEEGKSFKAAARRLQSRSGIDSIVKLCRAPLVKDVGEFDKDLMALNTPAGLVDLRTGTTRLSVPDDRVSRTTAVSLPEGPYDPEAAPHWEAFLAYLSNGSPEFVGFLKRYMGYCLTGHMGEKKFAFVWGSNSNTGKSTFVNAVAYVLGDYAASVDVDMFMRGRRSNTDDLAQLPGVRLVTATEPSVGQRWDDKLVKAITGGDPITARKLYQSHFTYYPQFKILIAGNHEPELRDVDSALLKRILIVPMNRKVEQIDRELKRKLEDEAPQILRWMVDGCLEWARIGLQPPSSVDDATGNYADTEDTIGAFLDERVEFDAESFTPTAVLFRMWQQWCAEQGIRHTGHARQFGREIEARAADLTLEHGVGVSKVKHRRWGFKGMRPTTTEVFDDA